VSESEMYRSGEFADRALACEEAGASQMSKPKPTATTKRRIEMWVARARTVLKRQHKGAKKGE